MNNLMKNFPKIHCPFVREYFELPFKVRGRNKVYLVTDKVNPGYEWVFEDEDTIAVEKLDGTNIQLKTEDGRLVSLQNRLNPIDPLQIVKGQWFILEGVFKSIGKGYVKRSGEQAGELIGPKLQGNPYGLTTHLWIPFEKAVKQFRYKSFHKHDRTFDNWSSWFKDYLPSLFAMRNGRKDIIAEGVVFYNLKRKSEGKIYMAKLRRDMFDWYYRE